MLCSNIFQIDWHRFMPDRPRLRVGPITERTPPFSEMVDWKRNSTDFAIEIGGAP
jgi:hypothetical protein